MNDNILYHALDRTRAPRRRPLWASGSEGSKHFRSLDVPLPVQLILRQRCAVLASGLVLVASDTQRLKVPFVEPRTPRFFA